MTWILITAILIAAWAILRLLGSEREQSLAALEYHLTREQPANPADRPRR